MDGPHDETVDARAASAERSDPDIVAALGAGSVEALTEVRRRHGRAVLRCAAQLVRDDALAEDVAQEVFLRLWLWPGRFDPARGTLRAYLVRDTRGRSIDVVRNEESRRRREERAADRSEGGPGDAPAIGGEELLDALARLSIDQRQAVHLAFYGGHSYREVASLLSIPEGTVKSRIRKALVVLRAELRADDGDE